MIEKIFSFEKPAKEKSEYTLEEIAEIRKKIG